MILELTIHTAKYELPPRDLIEALNKSTNGYSVVIVFATRITNTDNVTKVWFGASNKRKVLDAIRSSEVNYTRIRRCDKPNPRLIQREVNGPPPEPEAS